MRRSLAQNFKFNKWAVIIFPIARNIIISRVFSSMAFPPVSYGEYSMAKIGHNRTNKYNVIWNLNVSEFHLVFFITIGNISLLIPLNYKCIDSIVIVLKLCFTAASILNVVWNCSVKVSSLLHTINKFFWNQKQQ